jgi:hypothetical protein
MEGDPISSSPLEVSRVCEWPLNAIGSDSPCSTDIGGFSRPEAPTDPFIVLEEYIERHQVRSSFCYCHILDTVLVYLLSVGWLVHDSLCVDGVGCVAAPH